MINNYAWALSIWWKRKIFIYQIKCFWILDVDFSFKVHLFFIFCSDFNLEATVVKPDEIRGLKQLFTPYSLLIRNTFFSEIINNS